MNVSVWTVYSAGNQFLWKVTFPFFPCFFLTLLFSEALGKMKDVYEKNPQMGDPASLASQISQTSQNIERLRGELSKYEVIYTSLFIYTKRVSLPLVMPSTLKWIYKMYECALTTLWCPFLWCRSGLLKQEDVGRRCATKPTHSIIMEHMMSTGIPDLLREGCLCQLCRGNTVSLFVSAALMELTRMKALLMPPRPSTQSLTMTLRMRN